MNITQTQLFQLLLCLQRLEKNNNPNIDNGILNKDKNVELYKGVLGMMYTVPNLRRIGACLINTYNIKDMSVRICSSSIHTDPPKSLHPRRIRLSKQPQMQTYIFNPITPREFEKGIYTLQAKIPTHRISSFVMGLSNKQILEHQNIYYYYLSQNTQYMWLNLGDKQNYNNETISLSHYYIKINKKLATSDTFTFDIFNRDAINPPKEIKNQYHQYGENWSSIGSGGEPVEFANHPHTLVKIIYHSYDHTIQYYINETLLCTIPAEIDTENMYPFITGTSYEQASTIEFV